MNEKLLQYIWQQRLYRSQPLFTTDQQPVVVIQPGILNHNQGPDFLNARVKIGPQTWVGHVELHVMGSEWEKHGHSTDHRYRNVVLHVVWKHDKELPLTIPTLELQNLVPKWLISRYDRLMSGSSFIPCAKQLTEIPGPVRQHWADSLLSERMQEKSREIEACLTAGHGHWEEVFWQFLARNFGFPVNQDLFLAVARSIPLALLSRHKHRSDQLEAILLGQSGLLEKDFSYDDYAAKLKIEYQFLKNKYALQPVFLPVHLLRMRPANFPGIRLAQLASLIRHSRHLFSALKEMESLDEVRSLFRFDLPEYWREHYMPGMKSAKTGSHIGNEMVTNILINTIIPFLFCYGHFHRLPMLRERAVRWLRSTAAEENKITRAFAGAGWEGRHAYDTQAMLQLKKFYCDERRCLQCAIGNHLLKTLPGQDAQA